MNAKFRFILAATNSNKSMHIIHENFFFPEFHSPLFYVCVMHQCLLYTNNYDIYRSFLKFCEHTTKIIFQIQLKHDFCIFIKEIQLISNIKISL